eukprot:2201975-Alexandrium_andersonii.AAC.1
MSASLVGSEMCIRDRARAVSRGAGAREANMLARAPLGSYFESLALPGGLPVSYTHLTLPTICSV